MVIIYSCYMCMRMKLNISIRKYPILPVGTITMMSYLSTSQHSHKQVMFWLQPQLQLDPGLYIMVVMVASWQVGLAVIQRSRLILPTGRSMQPERQTDRQTVSELDHAGGHVGRDKQVCLELSTQLSDTRKQPYSGAYHEHRL